MGACFLPIAVVAACCFLYVLLFVFVPPVVDADDDVSVALLLVVVVVVVVLRSPVPPAVVNVDVVDRFVLDVVVSFVFPFSRVDPTAAATVARRLLKLLR